MRYIILTSLLIVSLSGHSQKKYKDFIENLADVMISFHEGDISHAQYDLINAGFESEKDNERLYDKITYKSLGPIPSVVAFFFNAEILGMKTNHLIIFIQEKERNKVWESFLKYGTGEVEKITGDSSYKSMTPYTYGGHAFIALTGDDFLYLTLPHIGPDGEILQDRNIKSRP